MYEALGVFVSCPSGHRACAELGSGRPRVRRTAAGRHGRCNNRCLQAGAAVPPGSAWPADRVLAGLDGGWHAIIAGSNIAGTGLRRGYDNISGTGWLRDQWPDKQRGRYPICCARLLGGGLLVLWDADERGDRPGCHSWQLGCPQGAAWHFLQDACRPAMAWSHALSGLVEHSSLPTVKKRAWQPVSANGVQLHTPGGADTGQTDHTGVGWEVPPWMGM